MNYKSFKKRVAYRSIILCRLCSALCITVLGALSAYGQDAEIVNPDTPPLSRTSVNAPGTPPQNDFPNGKTFSKNALRLHIVTRVIDSKNVELSFDESDRITISGKPVSMKLVGDDVILALTFTAYPRAKAKGVLAAQSQVWVQTKNSGLQYKSTLQTVEMEYGKKILFFPLGQATPDASHIEIQVEVFHYSDNDADSQTQE